MKTILFQGDSITSSWRNREDPRSLGDGFASMVAAQLGLQHPGEYVFYNCGLGGNRSGDLYGRIQGDIINLPPDYISILIGVNDVLLQDSRGCGVSVGKFHRIYSMLLDEILESNPNVKIMLIAPFVSEGPRTADRLDWFRREIGLRADVVHAIARKYQLPVLDLQSTLDQMVTNAPYCYWLHDGIHPTPFFHRYIADCWLSEFDKWHR